MSGDIFSYVTLNDNESQPEILNEFPDEIRSGDILVSQDKPQRGRSLIRRETKPCPSPFRAGSDSAAGRRTRGGERHREVDERERGTG
ncbi:MAG: hypothetical protein ACLUEQ_00960 [Cloacibacillus evryensis]